MIADYLRTLPPEKLTDLAAVLAHVVDDTTPAPGFYPSMPQGHCQITDGRRSVVVGDLGGVVQVAGVNVTDPDALLAFGEHVVMLAGRLRERAR